MENNMDLPVNEKSFKLDYVGATTGTKYDGDFTVKCVLSIFEKREVELEKARIITEIGNPSTYLINLAAILANLRVRMIKTPSWWEQSNYGLNIMDEDALVTLYDKVMDQEKEWIKSIKKTDEEKPEGN